MRLAVHPHYCLRLSVSCAVLGTISECARAPTQDHERLVTRHVHTLRRIFGPAYWALVSDISLTVAVEHGTKVQ